MSFIKKISIISFPLFLASCAMGPINTSHHAHEEMQRQAHQEHDRMVQQTIIDQHVMAHHHHM